MQGNRFQEALNIVNAVLVKSPDFLKALYLKAQILWEGFGNYEQAVYCLDKILQLVDEQKGLHRWASTYYNELQNSRLLENG